MFKKISSRVFRNRNSHSAFLDVRLKHCQYLTHSKIFVVGNNKTGTTSLEHFFKKLGFLCLPQQIPESLYFENRHNTSALLGKLNPYIRSFEVFQDLPFSETSILDELVRSWPHEKYIYTMRSKVSWYNSLLNHHSQTAGFQIDKSKKIFSIVDTQSAVKSLKKWSYRGQNMYEHIIDRYSIPSSLSVYDFECLISYHMKHEHTSQRLLAGRDALFLDITTDPNASKKICEFISLPFTVELPIKNKRNINSLYRLSSRK